MTTPQALSLSAQQGFPEAEPIPLDDQAFATLLGKPRAASGDAELLRIQTELSKQQLKGTQDLQPLQQRLIELTLGDLDRQAAQDRAFDSAVTPEQQAALFKQEFERAQRLGPIQDELLQLQLEQLRRGGAATPEQIARIKAATDAGIEAGSADIDLATQRGIGLIADELANSRGLRLTDTPILREATLLARSGADQKASLIKNLRAGQATAELNFPLASAQITSGINLGQQNLAEATKQFQAELRQRAFQNRLALSGQTLTGGIGLASVGGTPAQGIAALRGNTTSSGGRSSSGLGELGQLAGGIGGLITAFSDRRLKTGVVKVGDDPRGWGIYEYDLFGRRERGVMADEVERFMPEAVSLHESGYKVVHYGMLR